MPDLASSEHIERLSRKRFPVVPFVLVTILAFSYDKGTSLGSVRYSKTSGG